MTDAEYVKQLYAAIGRDAPDTDGVNYWNGELAKGKTREQLAADFGVSAKDVGAQETAALLDQAAYTPGGDQHTIGTVADGQEWSSVPYWSPSGHYIGPTGYTPQGLSNPYQQNIDFVNSLYSSIGRGNPDQQGVDYWVSQMTNGASQEELMKSFVASANDKTAQNNAVSIDSTYTPSTASIVNGNIQTTPNNAWVPPEPIAPDLKSPLLPPVTNHSIPTYTPDTSGGGGGGGTPTTSVNPGWSTGGSNVPALSELFPRVNWGNYQTSNRGSRYFDTMSGNYQGLSNLYQGNTSSGQSTQPAPPQRWDASPQPAQQQQPAYQPDWSQWGQTNNNNTNAFANVANQQQTSSMQPNKNKLDPTTTSSWHSNGNTLGSPFASQSTYDNDPARDYYQLQQSYI